MAGWLNDWLMYLLADWKSELLNDRLKNKIMHQLNFPMNDQVWNQVAIWLTVNVADQLIT